jgi:Transglutaminase-like superfamily
MKMMLTILLLFVTGILFPQDRSFIDKPIQSPDPGLTDPAALSRILTFPFHTEKDKVRSIFVWITENISYYRGVSKNSRKKRYYAEEDGLPDTGALKSLTERVAIKVLQDRRTYCDGYARLFKSLCDHASVRSEIITGYARADMSRAEEKFRSNHSWNAVYIDSAWQLLDVTWASGYISRSSNDFVKHFDDYYFLTPPEQFIRHHYPDDLRWTLLSNPPPLYEFNYTPFKQRSYVKYDISGYYPTRGIIEARVGDTIHLELETNNMYLNRSIAPDSLWDSSALVISPLYTYVNPELKKAGRKVVYSFPVNSDAVEWLHIMYNNDAVLRYKLNIKKK